jgi:hypothetical protein
MKKLTSILLVAVMLLCTSCVGEMTMLGAGLGFFFGNLIKYSFYLLLILGVGYGLLALLAWLSSEHPNTLKAILVIGAIVGLIAIMECCG